MKGLLQPMRPELWLRNYCRKTIRRTAFAKAGMPGMTSTPFLRQKLLYCTRIKCVTCRN
jgi:hypothetical protein